MLRSPPAAPPPSLWRRARRGRRVFAGRRVLRRWPPNPECLVRTGRATPTL